MISQLTFYKEFQYALKKEKNRRKLTTIFNSFP